MKHLILIVTIFLASCTTFIMPIKYDPAQVNTYVQLKDQYEDLSCDTKNIVIWDAAIRLAHQLALHSEFRDDPQTENVRKLEASLTKAYNASSVNFCEAKMSLVGVQMHILEKAWRGRD